MRLNEVLTESAIQELNEGPFGQAVGRAAGGLARGAGAVAGGIAGMGSAAKQGFQAGKAAVAGTPGQQTQQPAQTGTAKQQAAGQPQVQQGREATVYSQVKDLVGKLDKKGKQRILAALAKDLGITGSAPQPAAKAQPTKSSGNYDPNTGKPLSDKAKADAAFDASPQGQAIQAKVNAMPAPSSASKSVKKAGNPAAPAGTPAAKPKVVRGGKAKAA